MKTFKILFAVAITLSIGFAVSAFKTDKEAPQPLSVGWFELNNPSHPELATSYTYVGTTMPCEGDGEVCAIKGTRNTNPLITIPYQADVDDAAEASENFAYPVEEVVGFKN